MKSLVDRSKHHTIFVLILVVFFFEFVSFWNPSIQLPRESSSSNKSSSHQHRRNITYPTTNSPQYACSNDTTPAGDSPQPSYSEWRNKAGNSYASDEQSALCAAHRQSLQPIASGTPRIAFLFITRGPMPLEPLWSAFFRGHEDRYSLYVHATDKSHKYEPDSLFHNHTIPSRPVDRYQISFCEAVRRLVAYALLDASTPNAWFTVVGDATLPVRPFPFVYTYIANSNLSFVESFASNGWRRRGGFGRDVALTGLREAKIRKGEPWVTLQRRHAGMLIGDETIFPRFKRFWAVDGIPSEYYIATLFSEMDPAGIANRSVMFVNWLKLKDGHPTLFTAENFGSEWVGKLQRQTVNSYGFFYREYRDVIPEVELNRRAACGYNGQTFSSPCFLFARKFSHRPDDLDVFRKVLIPALVAEGPAGAEEVEQLLRPLTVAAQ